MSKVAIAGTATHGFTKQTSKSNDEMLLPTSKAALQDAGISHEAIDALVFTGQDTYDGCAISDGQKVSPSGAYNKPIMRIQMGGGAAIHQAMAKILSGKADVVSVLASDFVTSDPTVLSWAAHEALYHRPIGQNHRQTYGLITTNHLESREATVEDLARTAAKNYEAAADSPTAARQEAYSAADVLDADPVVGHLTELMLGPMSYGAAVCILISEQVAEDLGGEYVWVTGSGLNTARYPYRDMDELLDQPTLEQAASQAYGEADITPDAVDVAEIVAPTPSFELLSYESLGFCAENEAASLVADGVTAPDGTLPVNLSGGPLGASPPNSRGIHQIVSAENALKGDLGEIDAETAIVADNDMHLGEPARTDAVLVMEGVSA